MASSVLFSALLLWEKMCGCKCRRDEVDSKSSAEERISWRPENGTNEPEKQMKCSSWTQAVQLRDKTFLLTPKVRCAFINTFAKEVIFSARFLKLSARLGKNDWHAFHETWWKGVAYVKQEPNQFKSGSKSHILCCIFIRMMGIYAAFVWCGENLKNKFLTREFKYKKPRSITPRKQHIITHNTSSCSVYSWEIWNIWNNTFFLERIPHSVLWWNCRVVYLGVLIKKCTQWVFFMNNHNLDNMTWWVKHNNILK